MITPEIVRLADSLPEIHEEVRLANLAIKEFETAETARLQSVAVERAKLQGAKNAVGRNLSKADEARRQIEALIAPEIRQARTRSGAALRAAEQAIERDERPRLKNAQDALDRLEKSDTPTSDYEKKPFVATRDRCAELLKEAEAKLEEIRAVARKADKAFEDAYLKIRRDALKTEKAAAKG